jgi:hypothetical protein
MPRARVRMGCQPVTSAMKYEDRFSSSSTATTSRRPTRPWWTLSLDIPVICPIHQVLGERRLLIPLYTAPTFQVKRLKNLLLQL